METEMKNSIIISCVIFCILALFWSSSVSARGGHRFSPNHNFGHHYGHDYYRPHRYSGFYFGPPFLSYSYIHTTPTRVIREIEEPVIYIEKPSKVEEPVKQKVNNASNYWYYCKKPGAYYPEVERCPDGWMQVVPQKPPN